MKKKLFVGQRVRTTGIWIGPADQNPSGKTGVITDGPGCFVGIWTGKSYTWAVTLDDPSFSNLLLYANSDELEPIIDPGREVTTWDKCLWQPSLINN